MTTILVVDDEPNILELARIYLEKEGYKIEPAGNGREALEKVDSARPALMVLDLMLPDMDGFDVCREVRKTSDLPILMLTARKDDIDKILGLELGADDYITKPFNPRELVARVKAVLRRYGNGKKPGRIIEAGNIRIDLAQREATIAGHPVRMRAKEFELLSALAQNLGIVLSRERLLELIWETDYYGETRTVDIHITHVRDRIEGAIMEIETVRGVGYKLVKKTEN